MLSSSINRCTQETTILNQLCGLSRTLNSWEPQFGLRWLVGKHKEWSRHMKLPLWSWTKTIYPEAQRMPQYVHNPSLNPNRKIRLPTMIINSVSSAHPDTFLDRNCGPEAQQCVQTNPNRPYQGHCALEVGSA